MPKVIKANIPPYNFDLTVPDYLPHVFADGVASINIGMPNSKLTFFRLEPLLFGEVPPSDGTRDSRKAVLEVHIPTAALIELAQNTLRSAAESRDMLERGTELMAGMFKDLLDKK